MWATTSGLTRKLAQSRCYLEDSSAFSRNLPWFIKRHAFNLLQISVKAVKKQARKYPAGQLQHIPDSICLGSRTVLWLTEDAMCILAHSLYHQYILLVNIKDKSTSKAELFELKLCCFALLLLVVHTKSAKSVKNSRYTSDSVNNRHSGKYVKFSDEQGYF